MKAIWYEKFGEAKEVTDQYMTGLVIRPKQ